MKTLDKFEIYPGDNMKPLETITERGIVRVSRWIEIKHNYNPNKNNHLWDYVTDDRAYHPCDENFDSSRLCLDYFKHGGRTYALGQFIALGGIADCIGHCVGYIENDEKFYLSGYDSESYFNALYIELDELCEKVRLYREA